MSSDECGVISPLRWFISIVTLLNIPIYLK